MITIDGSFGEGGGQILRTSLTLSLVTGKPFRIERIRAGRKNPGLLRQHLAAVSAAARVGYAEVEGASLGSRELTFRPQTVAAGQYQFAVGTAGSTTLVLQTVLPALMTADAPSTLALEGGTHNPFAPPFDFLEKAFLPLLNRMGPRIAARLERHGFYPAGGGRFVVEITPAEQLGRLVLDERGAMTGRRAWALIANLPRHIAERELSVIGSKLSLKGESLRVETLDEPRGPGNCVMIEIECDHVTEVFTAFGQRGVRAEAVAGDAAGQAREYMASEAAADEYLADQLLVPMALAGGGSFTAVSLSRHTTTNIEVIRKFIDIEISSDRTDGHGWRVVLKG
jgi:RNA 3'-terminal phosphate cyclase (ATP)